MLSDGLLDQEDAILKWMRDRYLRELVSDRGGAKRNVKESLSVLNLNPYFTFPAVALVETAAAAEGGSGRTARVERMRDDLQQCAGDGSVVFLDEEGRIGLLFSWLAQDAVESIRKRLTLQSVPVNIGVGKPCRRLSEVHVSYRQAALALRNKFYRGTGQIIHFSEADRYQPLQEYPAGEEKRLYEAVKAAASAEEIREAVDEFYRFVLRNGPLDIQHVYELTVRLLIGMEKKALSDAGNGSAYKRFDIMTLIKLETLQELKRYVAAYLAGLRDSVAQSGKANHRSIIKKTISYMERECRCATLNSAAKNVYMTPAYLSLLFKMNTGKTFIEHLTDIRIDKAKEMLRSTHLKNYEVADKVGYQDPRYFSQIFKKKVGVSPSEYRESQGK